MWTQKVGRYRAKEKKRRGHRGHPVVRHSKASTWRQRRVRQDSNSNLRHLGTRRVVPLEKALCRRKSPCSRAGRWPPLPAATNGLRTLCECSTDSVYDIGPIVIYKNWIWYFILLLVKIVITWYRLVHSINLFEFGYMANAFVYELVG
jgi:hypothetical protein